MENLSDLADLGRLNLERNVRRGAGYLARRSSERNGSDFLWSLRLRWIRGPNAGRRYRGLAKSPRSVRPRWKSSGWCAGVHVAPGVLVDFDQERGGRILDLRPCDFEGGAQLPGLCPHARVNVVDAFLRYPRATGIVQKKFLSLGSWTDSISALSDANTSRLSAGNRADSVRNITCVTRRGRTVLQCRFGAAQLA